MSEQCRYMAAAYPTLSADDTCFDRHQHDEPTFSLARAFAVACQDDQPSDEQVAWFLDDAAVVIDDFPADTTSWSVTAPQMTDESGLESVLQINGQDYVLQPSEWEPSHPVRRSEWERWMQEAEEQE